MLRLDKKNNESCTFNTLFRRFWFWSLSYGISCAPDICHVIYHKLFKVKDAVVKYTDYISISAPTEAKDNGIKFNIKKYQFDAEQVFLDISYYRVTPDFTKILAIQDMSTPSNHKNLGRFWGI